MEFSLSFQNLSQPVWKGKISTEILSSKLTISVAAYKLFMLYISFTKSPSSRNAIFGDN